MVKPFTASKVPSRVGSLSGRMNMNETIYNPITKEEVTFISTAQQSGGKETVLEILLGPKGKGPPLHYHKAITETFEVLEGELMLRIGRETVRLSAGQQATVNVNQRHTFWSEIDQPMRFRGRIEPGDVDIENCFRISFGLARSGLVNNKGIPKKLSHLAILSSLSKSNLAGMLSLIDWVFQSLARTNKYRAIRRSLTEEYCLPHPETRADG